MAELVIGAISLIAAVTVFTAAGVATGVVTKKIADDKQNFEASQNKATQEQITEIKQKNFNQEVLRNMK